MIPKCTKGYRCSTKRVAVILTVLLITTAIIAFFIPTNASAGTGNVKGSGHIPDKDNNMVYWHVPPGGGPQWSNTLKVDTESDTAHDMSKTVALSQRFGMGFPIREGPDEDTSLDTPMYFENGVVSGVAHLEFDESSQKPLDMRIWFEIYDKDGDYKVGWQQDIPYQDGGYYNYSLEIDECMADVGEVVNMGYNFQLNSGTTTWTIYVDGSSYSVLPITSTPSTEGKIPTYNRNIVYLHSDYSEEGYMNAVTDDTYKDYIDWNPHTAVGYVTWGFEQTPKINVSIHFEKDAEVSVILHTEFGGTDPTADIEVKLMAGNNTLGTDTGKGVEGESTIEFSIPLSQTEINVSENLVFIYHFDVGFVDTYCKLYTEGSSYLVLPIDKDTDVDGTYDSFDDDDDNDSMPDIWENTYGLNPFVNDAGEDPDNDNLTNLEEYLYNTNATNPDTDGDGLTDGEEVVTYGTDPTKPDTDGDGYNDKADYYPLDASKHKQEEITDGAVWKIPFSPVILIIAVAIIIIIGLIGAVALKHKHKKRKNS